MLFQKLIAQIFAPMKLMVHCEVANQALSLMRFSVSMESTKALVICSQNKVDQYLKCAHLWVSSLLVSALAISMLTRIAQKTQIRAPDDLKQIGESCHTPCK
jgi:hypothetical protein